MSEIQQRKAVDDMLVEELKRELKVWREWQDTIRETKRNSLRMEIARITFILICLVGGLWILGACLYAVLELDKVGWSTMIATGAGALMIACGSGMWGVNHCENEVRDKILKVGLSGQRISE